MMKKPDEFSHHHLLFKHPLAQARLYIRKFITKFIREGDLDRCGSGKDGFATLSLPECIAGVGQHRPFKRSHVLIRCAFKDILPFCPVHDFGLLLIHCNRVGHVASPFRSSVGRPYPDAILQIYALT